MKVTLNEYSNLPNDINSVDMMLAGPASAGQKLTAAGSFAPLGDEARFVRVATDTAIHVKMGAGAADTDPMMPAGTVEYFGAHEGTVVSIILA